MEGTDVSDEDLVDGMKHTCSKTIVGIRDKTRSCMGIKCNEAYNRRAVYKESTQAHLLTFSDIEILKKRIIVLKVSQPV